MSNLPFRPLVILEKKPILTKFEGVKINLQRPMKEVAFEREEAEEGQEVDVEEKAESGLEHGQVRIKDRRKKSRIDRDLILKKIMGSTMVKTKSELVKATVVETVVVVPKPTFISTGKKFVIKKPAVKVEEQVEVKEHVVEPTVEVENPADLKDLEKHEDSDDEDLSKLTEAIGPKKEVVALEEEKPAEKKGQKRGRKPKSETLYPEDLKPVDLTTAMIRTQKVIERLPKERERVIVKAPTYYMNNRKIFIQKLTELFKPYQEELLSDKNTVSCDTSSRAEDFDLLTHQKIVRDYLNLYTPYRGLLLYHGLGAGKCHAKGTAIMLSTGEIRLVEDIKVGDLLMGDDSKPRTVLSLARGRDKMYDIIPIKGEKYRVNQEHILCLRASGFPKFSRNNHKSNTNYNIQWLENNAFCSKTFTFNGENEAEKKADAEAFYEKIKTTKETSDNVYEVSVKDYLELSAKKKAFLKGYKVPLDFPERELPLDPYMLGYWLGDGTSREASITSQDSTVLYYFSRKLPEYNLSLNYRSGYCYGLTGNGTKGNNVFLNTLKDLNMISNKHIPMIYKCNSRENRLKLLAGLLDSDGCYGHGGFEFCQKNETLMDDVVFLARSLGFSCYKTLKETSWTYKGEKNEGTAWRICINGNGLETIPTVIPRKQASPRKQIKDVLVSGIDVEYVGEGDYYGFMLDGNCRYLIGDFTVTHNTCTSIAIAEGMKSNKRVFVMTPASLKMNFFSEMKKCGDHLYKKNQFWEFISIDGKPEYVGILSRALSLSTEYIRKNGGAWLVNVQKPANFTELDTEQQTQVDAQLNEMIRTKYTDINYNGLNMNRLKMLTGDFSHNPFDNSVIVIDEAHNFVSRIVNKIKQPKSISYILYDYLMSATNARVVLLSGTPIINYPNEIGILFNILRGYIKTWTIPLSWEKSEKLNTDTVLKMFDAANLRTFDYVDYADNKLIVTRNPFGFVNSKKRGALKGTQKIKPGVDAKTRKNMATYEMGTHEVFDRYNGVQLDDTGNITDDAFIKTVIQILKVKNGLTIREGSIEEKNHKSLPDNSEAFLNMFVNKDTGKTQNINLFQRRILGLTSYFRSAQEQLLPRYVKTEEGDIYYVVKTEMTPHQFGLYEKIRKVEADREKKSKKRKQLAGANPEELYKISSTYRIFSRACCNFAFPPGIERPVPVVRSGEEGASDDAIGEVDELTFDAVPKALRQDVDVYQNVEDVGEGAAEDGDVNFANYNKRIEKALTDLDEKVDGTNESRYLSKAALTMYSPKFAKILENLTDAANEGLHLLYSHFRTIEGIGIMRLILMANGFAEFKLQKVNDAWEIFEKEEDAGKPRFVLYTGTESPEEKEIIRNVYNGAWDFVPVSIANLLKERAENNNYGEIIKVFMITSSGAEGINLRNTRFVHIVEPYWHMVRVEQVVGRARRICSHQDLPEELRTVKVFLYISTFSEDQKTNEQNIELRIRDISRLDNKTPVTTDESLYEIASIKQRINNEILQAVKETAVDCSLYSALAAKNKSDEVLVCYGFGKIESNQFSSYPNLEKDQGEKGGLDVKKISWKGIKVTFEGADFALNEATNELYDYESYQRAIQYGTDPMLVGRLEKKGGKYKMVRV